ncbi:MAG: DUF1573 domain-containing protein [Candidatus Azobacteroides sp.]|nr:DUF1573 domain-containing protein [Candidatus Azobacteroides sp.]
MKRIGFLIAGVIFGFTLTFAQEKAAGFSVSEAVHDFGTIYQEDGNVSFEFTVTNTGNAPLELTRVTATCGCTTPDWTKTPIEPGQTGFVKVTYAAKGRPGKFEKTISIYTNVQDAPFTVKIRGEVLSKNTVDMKVKQPELISLDR